MFEWSRAALQAPVRSRALEWASLAYVSLPFLVFVLGWLRPVVAIPCAAITLAGLYGSQRVPAGSSGQEPSRLPNDRIVIAMFIFVVVAVVVVMLYSGTGGYATQFGGHRRNNAFINDLARHPWPLGYEDVGRDHQAGVLTFYIANALLPALVGDLFGWVAAFCFQLVWSCLALFLAIYWFMRVLGNCAPWLVLFFLFFGGLDLVGHWTLLGVYGDLGAELDLWTVFSQIRWPGMGGMFWIFPSNLTIVFNSPHHVFCSWIVLLMIMDDAIHRGTARRVGLLVAFALLWSAFSFVGMAPFVFAALWVTRGRGMLSFENLGAGVVVLAITALYIGTNNGDFVQGPLWQFQDLSRTWPLLLLFCVVEFGLYAILLLRVEHRRVGLASPVWRWAAIVTLVLVPWYRIGENCDFTTKASIPALLVLQLCLAHALAPALRRREWAAGVLVLLLIVGTAPALTIFGRSARIGLRGRPPSMAHVPATNEIDRNVSGGQLFSDGRGFFWERLARPVIYQPNAKPVGRPFRIRPRRGERKGG